MKKIRKKKKPVPKTPAGEEGLPALLKRMESFIRGNYQRAAVLGIVILFGIIFVPVYICYSYRRQNEAARVLERAFAIETLEIRLSLLQDVADEYGGTLSAARALYYLADGYYASEQYDLARTCYEEYLREYPRANFAPNAQEGLGYVAESEGKFDEAIEHYRKLVQRYGDSYIAQHAWYNIARCYEERGDWANAADAYEKQVSLYPESTWSDRAEARLGEVRLRLSSARPRNNADQFPGAPSSAGVAGGASD